MAKYILGSHSSSKKTFRKLNPIVGITVLVGLFLSVFGSIFMVSSVADDANANPAEWIICDFLDEENPIREIYGWTQTDELYFNIQSKSAVSSGKQDVSAGLNWILGISGMDFVETNTAILGQAPDSMGESYRPEAEMSEEELKEKWNKGAKVNPYDRFGMSGAIFTSYNGEWKYYKVDACNSEEMPEDLGEDRFYDDRMGVTSTWEDRSDSNDPRTMQHVKGESSRFWFGFVTLIANGIFWITKLITTLTLAFINFSFSDMIKTMGLDGILAGNTANDGIFGHLFNNLYWQLIVLVMAVTGFKILIDGVAKRQFRNAFGTLAISIAMFFLAIVVSVKPAFFVNLPNNAAITVQAVIVQAFTGGIAGEDSICATDSGFGPETKYLEGTSGKKGQDFMEKVAQNMRSSIGCTFWQTFVLQPWVEGQWGVSWNETWAKGSIPSWAPSGAKELQNSDVNADMVKNAEVPLGDGTVINNWAIFNISTLTNVHSPIGHEGQLSKYTQGVANDWWRIVDVLTNYEVTDSATATVDTKGLNKPLGAEEITFSANKENPPLEMWDTWSGNNPGNRFAAAVSSLFIGAVGLIAPFLFGLMAAVYSLAMTIVMVFLPVMLLLGAWGGRGFNIFKQWALLLWSLFTKRVAIGIMLMLSIVFVNASIVLMKNVGWWQGALMLVLISAILIKSRHKIADMLAASNAGSLSSVASRIGDGIATTGKTAGSIVGSTAAGGIYSKMRGGTFGSGAYQGMKSEFDNLSYKMPFLREVRMAQRAAGAREGRLEGADGKKVKFCSHCQEPFLDGDFIKMGPDGLWYCNFCAESELEIDGGVETFYRDAEALEREREEFREKTTPPSALNGSRDQARGGKLKRLLRSKNEDLDLVNPNSGRIVGAKVYDRAVDDLFNEIDKARTMDNPSDSAAILFGSNLPVELQPYLDSGMLQQLANNNDWEAIATAFVVAYKMAINAEIEGKLEDSLDETLDNGDWYATIENRMKTKLGAIQVDPRVTNDPKIRAQRNDQDEDEPSDE